MAGNCHEFRPRAGAGIRVWAESLKREGEYLKSHAVQALALEAAEGYAELLHARLREAWGFPDPAGMTMLDRFRSRYRGLRVSFGYPACPELEYQVAVAMKEVTAAARALRLLAETLERRPESLLRGKGKGE